MMSINSVQLVRNKAVLEIMAPVDMATSPLFQLRLQKAFWDCGYKSWSFKSATVLPINYQQVGLQRRLKGLKAFAFLAEEPTLALKIPIRQFTNCP